MTPISLPDISGLRTAFEAANSRAGWATVGVTAGVFIEFVALFVFSKEMPSLEKKINAVAIFLIVVGCAGEWWYESKADADATQIQSIEQTATAVALNEAEQTQLKIEDLEKKFAWRSVTPDQKSKILDGLGDNSFPIILEYSLGDPEAFEYANELFKVFTESKLKVSPYDIAPLQPALGVTIIGLPGMDRNIIAGALTKAGISFGLTDNDPVTTETPKVICISVGGRLKPI